jgi:large subunit ribosomal protein L25
MDFLRVRADQKLHMHVPLHFVGDEKAPGLSEGGVIHHNFSDVEVSCLPADLPEYIEVNTSEMKLNDVLHLSDIKLPKGVELVALSHGAEGHDLPIVSMHKPRIEEEVVAAPAEGEEAAAGEAAEGAKAEAKPGEGAADAEKGK